MKNFKRVLASALAITMLATSVNLSFASGLNFSDVDSKYSTAVSRLTSIDIVKGYEDGTFKPEGTITRAEAAAIMVRMLGKEKLASYSNGLSQFGDMTAAHWANGYVNVAASAGIIKGYPDGSFGPENKVTYAEIVTMMVRALGAGEAVGSQGTWPSNYLNFALLEGLTDDVAIVPNAPATRGDVAIIANTTLDTPTWKATGYNSDGTRTYEKTDATNGGEKTLFTDKLDLTKVEMATVSDDLGVSGNPDRFEATKDLNNDGDVADAGETVNYTFAEGLTKAVLPGQEIDIFLNDDNEVVAIQAAKDSKQKEVSFIDLTDNTNTKATLKLADGTEKSFDYASVAANILDGTAGAKGSADEDLDLSGTALLNKDGDITHLYLYQFDQAIIVDEVKVDADNNKYTIKSDADMPRSTTSSLVYDLDTDVVYVNNAAGQQISLEDIKAGDMLMMAGASNEYLLVIPANIVSGTIDSKDSESIEVNGQDYKFSPNFSGSVIDSYDIDDTVKLFLDAQGQIAMLDKTIGGDSTGDYGIITDFYRDLADAKGNTKAKIELFDLNSGAGTGLKTFDAEKTDDEGVVFSDTIATGDNTAETVDFFDGTNPVADGSLTVGADLNNYSDLIGQVVRYEISNDKIVIYPVDSDEIAVGNVTLDQDKEKFTMGSTNYYVDSNVKVYQADTLDDGAMPIKTINWSSLKDQTVAKSAILLDFDDDKEVAQYVFFNNSAESLSLSNDDNVGVITNVKQLTGGDFKVTVMTNEGSKFFYVTKDEAEDIDATGFDASTLDLDNSAEWVKFVGILTTYSADENGYVTKENIDFDNHINSAKFYEVSSRNEVKMLDNTDTAIDYDAFKSMFTVEADITTGPTTIKNIGAADVSDIQETDKDITTYAAADADEASTVYYYVVNTDDDGDLTGLNGSNAVAVMIYDSNEF